MGQCTEPEWQWQGWLSRGLESLVFSGSPRTPQTTYLCSVPLKLVYGGLYLGAGEQKAKPGWGFGFGGEGHQTTPFLR